jgi:hypothetical protein
MTSSVYVLFPDEEEDQEDNEILQRAGSFISKKTDHLPKGIIDIGNMKDANCSKPFDVSEVFFTCIAKD